MWPDRACEGGRGRAESGQRRALVAAGKNGVRFLASGFSCPAAATASILLNTQVVLNLRTSCGGAG